MWQQRDHRPWQRQQRLHRQDQELAALNLKPLNSYPDTARLRPASRDGGQSVNNRGAMPTKGRYKRTARRQLAISIGLL